MYECRFCQNLMEDGDFALITYKGHTYGVCPDCLNSLISKDSVREIPEDEERSIREEWSQDARYEEMKLEEVFGGQEDAAS